MKGTPQALLLALQTYGIVPDGLGEFPSISYAQAAAIRAVGYTANGGRTWRCPILPDDLVRDTVYAHLSDALERSYGNMVGEWRRYRSHVEGDRAGAYAHLHKARLPDGSRSYCPVCRNPNVQPQANAQTHAHIDNALKEAREHIVAAARALGLTVSP
jgi:hypothetical protein